MKYAWLSALLVCFGVAAQDTINNTRDQVAAKAQKLEKAVGQELHKAVENARGLVHRPAKDEKKDEEKKPASN